MVLAVAVISGNNTVLDCYTGQQSHVLQICAHIHMCLPCTRLWTKWWSSQTVNLLWSAGVRITQLCSHSHVSALHETVD